MTVTTKGGTFTAKEIEQYKMYLEEKFPNCEVESLILEVDEEDKDFVKMNYTLKNKEETDVPFERIRRITGYLGNISRINNAKQHEIHDRVMHN